MLYVNSGSNKNVLMLMLHITTVPNLLSHKDTMKWVGVLILSKKMTGQVILQWKKTHFQNAFLVILYTLLALTVYTICLLQSCSYWIESELFFPVLC